MKIRLLIISALLSALVAATGCGSGANTSHAPGRPAGQEDVLGLKCEPLPVVRVGFVGLGMRGKGAVQRFTEIGGVRINALCDLEKYNLDDVREVIAAKGLAPAAEYSGAQSWKELCRRNDIDLVYICTDWRNHARMAVYAMEQGKHVAVEVPAAMTVEECWQLVNTAERTRRHCIMLENCCYDRFEMATLNMAQQGLFGEIVHAEGAYIHDLRELNFNDRVSYDESYQPGIGNSKTQRPGLSGYWNQWRLEYDAQHTGNPYPTHGLGPVCQALGIHRGDRMKYLVSVSSDQFGLTEYARKRFGDASKQASREYALGDMNTTVIKTEKGKTIMIQHDVTSPRPYSRIHTLSGTKGFAQKWPVEQIALEPEAHNPLPKARMDSLLCLYDHPFYRETGDKALELGHIAHGGMDYIMDYRLVWCLRNGLPLDMDVYDAAEWSCLVELTEKSARNGGMPVEIPDFTRGAWDKLQGLKFEE